ncbi:MAG: helix-turn-helix domain-containing protein [Blastococcus sp.]
MKGTPSDSGGMNPLQALILERMSERGWTPKDVEARGVNHATLHRYMNPLTLKAPPRRDTLQKLANALDLPLSRVERAAVESVGYLYSSTDGAGTWTAGDFLALPEDEKQAWVDAIYPAIKDYLR